MALIEHAAWIRAVRVDDEELRRAAGRLRVAVRGILELAALPPERDLAAVRAAGLAGVIVGRALYEGQVDLRQAVEQLEC